MNAMKFLDPEAANSSVPFEMSNSPQDLQEPLQQELADCGPGPVGLQPVFV